MKWLCAKVATATQLLFSSDCHSTKTTHFNRIFTNVLFFSFLFCPLEFIQHLMLPLNWNHLLLPVVVHWLLLLLAPIWGHRRRGQRSLAMAFVLVRGEQTANGCRTLCWALLLYSILLLCGKFYENEMICPFVLWRRASTAPHAAVLGDSKVMYNLLQLMGNIRRIMSMQSTRAYSEARQHASSRWRQRKALTPLLKLKRQRTMLMEERLGPESGPAVKVTLMSTWTLA